MAETVPPYHHLHPVRALFAISSKPPTGLSEPSRWSRSFSSFVASCLQEAHKRPCANALLQHAFLSGKSQESLRALALLRPNKNDDSQKTNSLRHKRTPSMSSYPGSGRSPLNDVSSPLSLSTLSSHPTSPNSKPASPAVGNAKAMENFPPFPPRFVPSIATTNIRAPLIQWSTSPFLAKLPVVAPAKVPPPKVEQPREAGHLWDSDEEGCNTRIRWGAPAASRDAEK